MSRPTLPTISVAKEPPRTYQAEWTNPANSRQRCGVSAGESGVTLWWRSGPSPNDEWGRGFTWDEWFEQGGSVDPGGPADLLSQIEALGRRLGHVPAPVPPRPKPGKRRRRASPPPTWSKTARALLQWSPGSTPELRRLALESGLHWVLPIGTTTYECWLGVRLLGGVPLERCPVVLCHGANAATVATELGDSLAILLWWLGPRDSLENLARVKAGWEYVEDEVLEQAGPFGGEAAVRRFAEYLAEPPDPALAEPANTSASLRAVAAVISRLDPLQAGFRAQVVALGEGREGAELDPSLADTGLAETPRAWHEALAASRFVRHRRDAERAWAVAQGVPSLDTGARLAVTHFVNTKMDWSRADLHLAAEVALRSPRSGSVAKALTAQHEATRGEGRYDGLAHLEAAAEAELAGDHATAWTLLAGAGYWTHQRHGRANPVITEAARQLCRDAGWDEGPWEEDPPGIRGAG